MSMSNVIEFKSYCSNIQVHRQTYTRPTALPGPLQWSAIITFVDDAKCILVMRVCVSVCRSVCLSLAACPHYCTGPDVTYGNGRACPLVVHYWADLRSVHGFRCYDNIARTRNVSECLYSLYAWYYNCQCFCCCYYDHSHCQRLPASFNDCINSAPDGRRLPVRL